MRRIHWLALTVLLSCAVVLLALSRPSPPLSAQTIGIDDVNNTLTVTGANAGTAIAIRGTITNTSANNYPNAITAVFFREVAGNIALGDMTLSWWTGAPGWQPAGPQFSPTNYPGYQMELNIGGGGFPIPPFFPGAGTWIRGIANRNFGTVEAKVITYVPNDANNQYNLGEVIISELGPIDNTIRIDLLGFNLETVYVDDDWAGCNVGNPALNIPTQEVAPGKFCQINAFDKVKDGISNVYGSTVNVAPGTYNEQVVVNTDGITLAGPNAGVDPGCSGTRPSAEATIAWSTLTGIGTASTVVIAADDVTVDGFTIQNTNGTQNQVSVLIGGHFVGDTTRPADGAHVRNSIISSGYNNIYVWQSSDNTIERNRVGSSVETQISIRDNAAQGTRDALGNSVLNNCIDKGGVASLGHSVAIGVTGGGAQDFSGTLIQGNTMKNSGAGTGQFRGVDAYLANGTIADPVRIYANTITDTSEQGIRIEGSNYYDVGGSSTATGNVITGSRGTVGGFRRGITTAGTSTGLSIQYNAISGHSSTSGNDAEIVITTAGNTILHNSLLVADSSPSGVGGLGLRVDNPSNVLGQNTYRGDGQRMLQVSGAPGPGLTIIDAVASTFKTAAGTTLDPNSSADLISIEDRVRHHMDVPSNLVLVIFKSSTTVATAQNNATTPGAIQRAVNAVPGSTVVVGPGTYAEQVVVNKSVTLTGAGAGSTIIQAPAVMATESDGDGKSIVEITGGATTASMSGFTVQGPLAAVTSAVHVHNGASATITANAVQGTDALGGGLIGHAITVGTSLDGDDDGAGTATITNNQIAGFHRGGIVVTGPGNTATISGNTVTGAGSTGLTTQQGITIQNAATGTISGNTVRSLLYTGAAPQTATGIFLWDSANGISITGNTLEDTQTGIMVQAATGIQISSNQITDLAGGPAVQKGMWLLGRGAASTSCDGGDGSTPGLGCATGATISDNTLTGNGTGDGIFTGKTPELSFTPAPTTVTISSNAVSGWDPGVSLGPTTGSGTSVGPGNNISGNDEGVFIDSASGVTVTANTISAPITNPANSGLHAVGAANLSVRNNTITGGYDAIKLRPGVTGTIADNVVSGYAKNGITVGKAADNNTGTNVTVARNTVTGGGAGQVNAQNGIQVGPNAVATVKDNSVTNHVYTLGTGACAGPGTKGDAAYYAACWTAAGILVYQGTALITGNGVTGNQVGIDVASGAEIHYNLIWNNVVYGANNNTAGILNGEHNWWGTCDGPYPGGSGDAVSPLIDYDPWLHGACDFDADLLSDDSEILIHLTDWKNPDTDGDGCADGEELLMPRQLGGGRNPLNPYDFYDITGMSGILGNKDKGVSGFDSSLLSVYGGARTGGPPNAFGKSYDADTNSNTIADGLEMDFAGLAGPGTGPDGGISGFDSSDLSNQGGHSCAGPP